MEYLPCELIDLICQWLTLREITNLSLTNQYLYQSVQQNHFYLFCKKSFSVNEDLYICNLMQNTNYFQRFYLGHTKRHNNSSLNELETARWLIKRSRKIRIDTSMCGNGHSKITRCLINMCPKINTHACNNCIFEMACGYGHLEIAKWLVKNYQGIDIRRDCNYAFRWACEGGHLETAKWLKNICPSVTARYDDDYVFRKVCTNGYLEMAKWLTTIYPDYVITRESPTIFYKIKN